MQENSFQHDCLNLDMPGSYKQNKVLQGIRNFYFKNCPYENRELPKLDFINN